MRKEKSWTRQDYEQQYEYIRRGCDVDYLMSEYPGQEEAIKAADYSYQAKDHFVNGWSNGIRFNKFAQAMLLNKYSVWGIPF